MPALTVTQGDADRAAAANTEACQILKYGAKVGATEVVAPIPNFYPNAFSPTVPDGFVSLVKSLAIAVVRLVQNGTIKFPTMLPVYSRTALPSAAANPYCLIYVWDATGGAGVAYSDAASWWMLANRGSAP